MSLYPTLITALAYARKRGLPWILRDEFIVDDAAPLTTPRVAEPGPQELVVVQSDGQFSIDNEVLVLPGQGTPAWADLYLRSDALARVAGRVLYNHFKLSTLGESTYGWSNAVAPTGINAAWDGAIKANGTGVVFQSNGSLTLPGALVANYDYYSAGVLRNIGEFLFLRLESGKTILVWVSAEFSNATLYAMIADYSSVGTSNYIRVRDLPAPFDTDYGLAQVNVTSATQSVGANLITNGNFSAWTGDNPDSWTVTGEVGADPEVTQRASNQGHGAAPGGLGAANLYSSATANAPFIFQSVGANNNRIYEVQAVISNYVSGSLNFQDAGGLANNSKEYSAVGTYQFLFAPRTLSNGIIARGRTAPTDITLDNITYQEISRNVAQTANPDAIHIFEFTVPASPVAGQEIHLVYRVAATGEEFVNSWDAYIRRNQANNAWDFRLDSIAATIPTNRLNVTGVGTPTAIMVIVDGNNHDCYTREGTSWTKRGAQVAVSLYNANTLINTVYSTGTTFSRLHSYARHLAIYDQTLYPNNIDFIINDNLYTSRAAGFTSPRTAEPSPGQLRRNADTSSLVSITGGKLKGSGLSANNFIDPGYYWTDSNGNAITRTPGRAAWYKNLQMFVATRPLQLGWSNTTAVNVSTIIAGMYFSSASQPMFRNATNAEHLIGSLWSVGVYQVVPVLFASGFALFVKGGIFGTRWKLAFIHDGGSDASVYPAFAGVSQIDFELDAMHVFDTDIVSKESFVTIDVTSFNQSFGAELLTNGNFSAWSGNDPTGWTVVGEVGADPAVSEVASGGGAGTGAARLLSSATNSAPTVRQNILIAGFYEFEVDLSARTSGSLELIAVDANFVRTYSSVGIRRAIGRINSSGNFVLRGSTAPNDFTINNAVAKRITLGEERTITADAINDLYYTLPTSPIAGQEIHLIYRIEATGDEQFDCWDLYIRRNDGNTNWDLRLDSISAGTITNRTNVTSIGNTDGIRVICEGSAHLCYSRATGTNTWVRRGAEASVSHLNTATLANVLYSEGFTVTRFMSWPRFNDDVYDFDQLFLDDCDCDTVSNGTTGESFAFVAAATGDGVTDTAAIQSAINSLPQIGGTVQLDFGTYVISDTLLIPSNITLDLNGATLQADDNLNDNILQNEDVANGNENIVIRNGTIEGNSANQTPGTNPCHGIALYYTSSSLIEDVTVHDCELDGIYMGVTGNIDGIACGGPCSGITIRDNEVTDNRRNGISVTRGQFVEIDNVTALGNNVGVLDDPLYYAGTFDFEPNEPSDVVTDIEVRNCNITAEYAPAIMVQATSGTKERYRFHNNTITQTDERAIVFFSIASDVVITNNDITTINSPSAIWLNGQTQIIDNVTISGNVINGDDETGSNGIGLNYVENGVVNGNTIEDYTTAIGVLLLNDDVAVTNNTFVSCTSGVNVTGGSTNITQSGNTP